MKIVKKVLILLLVFTVLFNTIMLPVNESHAIGLTLGALYGVTVGEALLAFILSSVAVGVTYATLEEAKNAYDLKEAIRFEELMMIPSIDPRPPGEPEPPGEPPKNWRDQMNKLLKGTGLSGLGLVLLYNLKEWYQGLGVQEGENVVYERLDSLTYDNDTYSLGRHPTGEINGLYVNGVLVMTIAYTDGELTGFEVIGGNRTLRLLGNMYDSDGKRYDFTFDVKNLPSNYPELPIIENTSIFYNVSPNSSVLTDTLPNRSNDLVYDGVSQGEMIYPGQLSNSIIQPNLDVIPTDRFETIILPNGTTQKVYKGSLEQMLEDIVNNTTIENVYNNTQDYTITNQGDTVVINEADITIPYPTPGPGETPSTPVDPGSQLDYTSWFQSIINWLSNIFNEIKTIPSKILEALSTLFVPQPNYLNSKLDNLQIEVNTKLNLPDLTPLPAIFDGIVCEPIPDGYIGGNKVFDSSYINNLASTISNWQRFLWWIVIILIGSNNFYKLIRGTDLITIKGPHGGGWSSKGG